MKGVDHFSQRHFSGFYYFARHSMFHIGKGYDDTILYGFSGDIKQPVIFFYVLPGVLR